MKSRFVYPNPKSLSPTIREVIREISSPSSHALKFGFVRNHFFYFSFGQIVQILQVSRFTKQHKGSVGSDGNRDF